MIGCVACGKEKGDITDSAVARVQSEEDEEFVYIDDEAIALAGSLSEQDPGLRQAAQDAFALTNQERAAAGLPALTMLLLMPHMLEHRKSSERSHTPDRTEAIGGQ